MAIDLKKEISTYRARKGRFEVVTVPALQFLMIDGSGDPNTDPRYRAAVSTLYPVSYHLKFFSKRELTRDYVVMPLEALWWSEHMDSFTIARDKSQWSWTAMIMVPDWLDAGHVDEARNAIAAKAGNHTAESAVTANEMATALEGLRLEVLNEGLAVQTLHVGPYDDEGPVLAEMHDVFIPAQSLAMTGRHHEIYLSDPRRAAPDKLRTILRQPVVSHT